LSTDLEPLPREIALLEQACQFLAECQDLDEVKDLRDKAEALRVFAKQQGDSQRAQNAAATIKLRAERRLGELLLEMPKDPGGRRSEKPVVTPTGLEAVKTLKELGIKKDLSAKCQAIAAIPEEVFEKEISKATKANRELSTRNMARTGRHYKIRKDRAERAADPNHLGVTTAFRLASDGACTGF